MAWQSGGRQPMSTGAKVLIGVSIAAVAPLFIAGAIAGVHNAAKKPSPAQAAPAHSSAPSTPPASSGPPPKPLVTAALDQDGDPGTPCAMTYTPTSDGTGTAVRFVLAHEGDVIAHLNGPDGTGRYTGTAKAGELHYTFKVPAAQVTDGGAILQDTDGTRHVCSIHAGQ